MDKVKKFFFFVFAAISFVNVAGAQDSTRPSLKIIPAPKSLKEERVCDYLLVVENFSKGELFVRTFEKFFFRDFGQFTKEVDPRPSSLFFAINAQDYPLGESISFRCVDITKNSGALIHFTPNPIENEEVFSSDVEIERAAQVLDNYYIQLEKEKIYTLADLEKFHVKDDEDEEASFENYKPEALSLPTIYNYTPYPKPDTSAFMTRVEKLLDLEPEGKNSKKK